MDDEPGGDDFAAWLDDVSDDPVGIAERRIPEQPKTPFSIEKKTPPDPVAEPRDIYPFCGEDFEIVGKRQALRKDLKKLGLPSLSMIENKPRS